MGIVSIMKAVLANPMPQSLERVGHSRAKVGVGDSYMYISIHGHRIEGEMTGFDFGILIFPLRRQYRVVSPGVGFTTGPFPSYECLGH